MLLEPHTQETKKSQNNTHLHNQRIKQMTSEGSFVISIDSHHLSRLHIGEKNNVVKDKKQAKPSSSPDFNSDSWKN